MEDFEVIKLMVWWGSNLDESLEKFGENKDKVLEYLKAHAVYDKSDNVSTFNDDFDKAYTVLRPFLTLFPGISLVIIYSGLEAGQDVFGRADWDLDDEDEAPESLKDAAGDANDYEYATVWFAEWAESHKEETAEWLSENNDNFDGNGWRDFADAFPEAEKEFFEMIETI
jgi:hypothetical protein